MIRPAAIYARVSSDRQKEAHTIASQTAALIQFAETEGFGVPKEWVFQDEGYSGSQPWFGQVWKRLPRLGSAEGHVDSRVGLFTGSAEPEVRLSDIIGGRVFQTRRGAELVFVKIAVGHHTRRINC